MFQQIIFNDLTKQRREDFAMEMLAQFVLKALRIVCVDRTNILDNNRCRHGTSARWDHLVLALSCLHKDL